MSELPSYTPFHPRWHRQRLSVWWWLERRSYALFVARELTSLAVGLFAFVVLFGVRALAEGPAAYAAFEARLRSPWLVALHVLILLSVLYHSITWFNLAPRAMVVRLKGRRVPDLVVAGANYLAWLVASVVVAFLLVRAR